MAQILPQKFAKVPEALHKSIARTRVTYRQLGKSGLRISNPVLGGMHLGSTEWFPWVLGQDKALPLLKAAYDCGINTWDTANVYSNGESEKIMGRALREYNIPRNKITLMTKCYRVVCDSENFDPGSGMTMQHGRSDLSKDYVNQWGLSRSAIFTAVEASLRRLNTDYIDVLQIHRYDETVPPEETMRALHDLVASGVVRYIGASSMWTYQFATLQHVAERYGLTKFISMQNHYNLLYREEEREMNKYCNMTGVGIMAWAPLAHGRLARHPDKDPNSMRASISPHGSVYTGSEGNSDGIISRVSDIAEKHNWPMSHVALAWLNKRVAAPVIGFSSVERINEALEARDKELTEAEETHLEELYVPRTVQGHD